MLVYKNCPEWHRFIMYPVTAYNCDENLSLNIVYNTQGYNIAYNKLLNILTTLEYKMMTLVNP